MIDRGIYFVNGKPFGDKVQAILEANKTKTDLSWNFHRESLAKLDWTTEPDISLADCYALRAQQIRDEFDYVVVMCSGGSDSTNVLDSFLDNGIFIDEVVASAPLSGLSSWNFNNKNTNATNFVSEVKYAQMPLMDVVRAKSPKTRLTLNDYFPLLVQLTPDDLLYNRADAIHPSALGHFNLELLTHLKDIAESGKRIAVVYGVEKPYLVRKNGNIAYTILDVGLNLIQQPFKTAYTNVTAIPFYIAFDFPQLMIKQAHVLAKWLFKPENAGVLSTVSDAGRDQDLPATRRRQKYSAYDRGIRSCIYPTSFDPKVFQTDKLSRLFFADIDYWFFSLHGTTKQYQAMVSEFNVFKKTIDRRYFNNDETGFIIMGNEYIIGPESCFC
jgi:hypothetical protein